MTVLVWLAAAAALGVAAPSAADEVPVGTILSQWDEYKEVFTAIQLALEQQHNRTEKLFHFKLFADNIKTVDAYKLTKIICRQFERGVFALLGTVDPESFDTLHSFANAFEMPFVTPFFPESGFRGPKDYQQEFVIQIRPDYHEGMVDLISYYGWQKIIYLYYDMDGLLRLQNLYAAIPKSDVGGGFQFHVEFVRKISTADEALQLLLELERADRNALKHVILDCPAHIAKELLLKHVQSVYLGRRNFHYLLSSLALDEEWDSQVAEYGAINVTGFRLVNPNSDFSRQFLKQWRQLDRGKYPAAGHSISAIGALAYDAVVVLETAFASLLQSNRGGFLRGHGSATSSSGRRDSVALVNSAVKKTKGPVSCDLGADERQKTWEHGATIVKALKAVNVMGLSGHIRFNEDGKRTNYSLDVVEMTPSSSLVKIGTWSDVYGLNIARNPLLHRGHMPPPRNIQNRTYVMTSILEEPYMMLRRQEPGQPALTGNDRFEGYCKDLADLIAHEAGVRFEIRPVRDNKYGSPDSSAEGGWNGMMGELVRREAEIAVAPLTINSAREKVADFTKPFMSLGISIMIKKPAKQRPGVFSFLNPLSMEIWMCVIFAYIGVSIVLFLVSRFSPHEWKIEGHVGGPSVANSFSVSNSLWFALGSFMQQGTDLTPRSTAGRMVGGAWWFFSLILISSYTANLAAFLTVERMVTPINSADELSQQTEIEYGALAGGSTMSFFKNSKIAVYARMWEFMSARQYVFTNTTQEGIQRVRDSKGKYAFLIESTTNEYTNERLPCDTMKVGKDLDAKGYGIATAKGSGLHNVINLAVLTLKENGDLAKLQNKWWYENTECHDTTSEKTKKNELSLSNVAGIFFILVGGLILAMAAALFEFCYNSKQEAKHAQTSLSAAMKNKARLALSGGRDLDNIRFYGDSSAL